MVGKADSWGNIVDSLTAASITLGNYLASSTFPVLLSCSVHKTVFCLLVRNNPNAIITELTGKQMTEYKKY